LTGIDDAARALSKALANVNVKCDFVSVPTHPTITKLRVLSRNQQLIRLDFEEGFSGVDPQPMHERIQQALGSIGALVLSTTPKGADQRPDDDQAGREAGVPVLIDPKGTDFERYRGATLLTPNLSEFEAVGGQDEAEIVERGMKIIADFELSALLVTRRAGDDAAAAGASAAAYADSGAGSVRRDRCRRYGDWRAGGDAGLRQHPGRGLLFRQRRGGRGGR
jgi:D-beta-D-heptose 7-phosphate kinase/D-beta-D-heptose 1-phosphate adenosyltransferase